MANGFLRVVPEDELQKYEQEDIDRARSIEDQQNQKPDDQLAAFIRKEYDRFGRHRSRFDIDGKYNAALRTYNGEYSPSKRAEIEKFGGSTVYSRITTVKCRGATAMLRDVFLGAEKPWALKPTPVPDIPNNVVAEIDKLIAMEILSMQQAGVPVDQAQVAERRQQLKSAAFDAGLKQASKDAKRTDEKLQDILLEGGFYTALAEFLIDLPIFPIACIKGPVVRNATQLTWVNGELQSAIKPKMFWYRVSPYDLFLDPAAGSNIDDITVMERIRLSRSELNALIGVSGYNEDAIRAVLNEYGTGGLRDWLDDADTTRADLEQRENPYLNQSSMIDTLEFHGTVQGKKLLEQGFSEEEIPDAELDYHITAWVIGRYVIKVQLNKNPNKRHPYYVTSFEKMPGSPHGHGLPEIIRDIQDVANASLRSLVNNMSISSGPQVAFFEDRLSPETNADDLYPWKRWRFETDPSSTNQVPISFFQPQSNAQELMAVYNTMTNIADETSAIPRYITGSEKIGGAGSTASGLAMLQNNATKVLQNVAANIDRDIISPLLQNLYHMVLLTDDTGLFKGDANVVVRGVEIALKKEQDRMRRLEFLQITGNPIDMEIIGMDGRAAILRSLSQDLGLPGESIVPTEEQVEQKQLALQQQQAAMAAAAQGAQPPAPGSTGAGQMGEETNNMFRNNAANTSAGRLVG